MARHPLRIAFAGPLDTAELARVVGGLPAGLPEGTHGAPLLVSLIAELLRRGHAVTAVTTSRELPLRSDGAVRCTTAAGLELVFVPQRPKVWPPNGWRPGRILDLYRFERHQLAHAIRAAGADLVHAHWAYEYAWAALDSGVPAVVTCHDSPLAVARAWRHERRRESWYRWLRAAMALRVLRRAPCVTTVSPYMQDQITALCRVPVQLVPNPLPGHLPAAAPARPPAGAGPRLVMACNGFSDLKNPQAALRAFAQVRAALPQASLRLFGADFEPGGRAETWCRRHDLAAGAHFEGSVTQVELAAALADAHLLIHPSLEESFGMVVAEAMACGVPVVGGRASGAVPWVVGDAGWLVDVSDQQAIAGAVIEAWRDRAALDQRGRRAAGSARARFSLASVVDRYEDVYRGALAATPRTLAGAAA